MGSDHAGVELKTHVAQALEGHRLAFQDFGPSTDVPVDYPDYAASVAKPVASGQFDRGILICGTGVGMAIAANQGSGHSCSIGERYQWGPSVPRAQRRQHLDVGRAHTLRGTGAVDRADILGDAVPGRTS